jgi:DNA-binding transcriptional ArsR family regulator
VSQKSQELLAFVRQLPAGFAYAPIYAKDCALQSGKISKGKTPLEKSHHVVMTPEDVALQIQRKPEVFQAVGVFTGARSKGLVILDVDKNLARLLKKWGNTLQGAPVVRSTKPNAAKYLFLVPEELWGQVKGFGLSDTGAGYEVLWGRQGLLYGAYPGSTDKKGLEGEYGFEGDLGAIPDAPGWLIAEMKEAAGKELADGGFIKNRRALDFSDRDPGEVAEIIQSALRVIPGQGAGSRDHWVKVGMAIHSELPTDLGLTLWSAWSAEDPEYSEEWAGSNPCDEVWKSFKKGPVTLGSLFWMADQQMPGRLWLSEDLRKVVSEAEQERVQRFISVGLSHKEIIVRAEKAMLLEDPSEVQHTLHEIAMEARYRDSSAVSRLLIAHREFKRGAQGGSLRELLEADVSPIEYLIPELLPKPGTLLLHGRGGCGKTMAALTIAKHIARGTPFSVRGADVPVEQGSVLWLNGDQNSRRIRKQFEDLDFVADDPVRIENKVSMLWYDWFIKALEKHQPKLVVWDSVTACMRGCAYDQNKAEYAEPMYWYSSENGESFPATTIVFIHHANKEGGFRGTTALEDAVDISMAIRRPEKKELEYIGASSRLITITKSREGNEGKQLKLTQQDDLTFSLADVEAPEDQSQPASVIDRVLVRLRESGRPLLRTQLNADPLCGGKVEAIRKALERLEDKGLVRSSGQGRSKLYEAVLARAGGVDNVVLKPKNTSAGTGSDTRTKLDKPEIVQVSAPEEVKNGETGQTRTEPDKIKALSEVTSLPRNGSGEIGQDSGSIFTREDRTPDELEQLMEEAANFWG